MNVHFLSFNKKNVCTSKWDSKMIGRNERFMKILSKNWPKIDQVYNDMQFLSTFFFGAKVKYSLFFLNRNANCKKD
jgi:hypothetical protein